MEIQDIIQGLTSAEIAAITTPEARTLIVNTTLQQAVIYVNGTFKQASFENTDDIPEGTKKFATTSDLDQINTNASDITSLQNGKEDSFTKNSAFNKNFGTSAGDVLQGDTRTITPTEISTIANQSGINTGDETDASIKSKYENNPDTNAYTDAEKTNLGNQSGTNTGDETTSTIQTKRPIKTVNGQTLEGSGNVNITSVPAINSATFISSIPQNVGTLLNGTGTNIQITLTNILGPNTFGYNISAGNVTIPTAGWYKVSLKGLINTLSNQRQNTSFVVKRNLINISGTLVSLYTRNNQSNDGSAAAANIIPQFQFSAGDTIGLYAISKGDNNQTAFTIPLECVLTLEYLG